MSSGWGCQYITKKERTEDWCRLLEHVCDPGCKGCILYGVGFFSKEDTPSNEAYKKRKKRSDDPLGKKR